MWMAKEVGGTSGGIRSAVDSVQGNDVTNSGTLFSGVSIATTVETQGQHSCVHLLLCLPAWLALLLSCLQI